MKQTFGAFRIATRVCVAAAIAGSTLPADAAEIFLRLGAIRGESTVAGHEGDIELLSYSQSFRAGELPVSGGGGPGRSTCGEVTVIKQIDRSSPVLIARVLQNANVGSADITFRGSAANAVEYYRVRLTDVFITAIEQTDQPDPQRIVERVSLRARAFRFEYFPQGPTGGPTGSVTFAWDCDLQRPS